MNSSTPPVFMVDLPLGSRLIAEGFPSHGVVLSYGGSPFKDFYANSHYILEGLISESELVFDDDPDWLKYPEIGPFLKQQCDEENCYTVVKCAKYGIWAIALAAGKKPRQQTSKMAMALALASFSPNAEQVQASYREYANLCRAIGSGGGGVVSQVAAFQPTMMMNLQNAAVSQGTVSAEAGSNFGDGGSGSMLGYGGKGVKGLKGMMGGDGGYQWSPYEMYGAWGKGGKGHMPY